MQNRREFLGTAGGPVLAALLASKADSAPEGAQGEARNRQPGMAYRRLGRTNFLISEVVMGGNTISPASYEHVLDAFDRGLNYLDTAPAYGNGLSEQGYAKVIKARGRDRLFINTKVSPWDINRGKLYQDIFDSLPASEKAALQNQVRDEIEQSRAFEPDYVGDYFKGQRDELYTATLANLMEKQYGRKIDRGKNYRQLVIDSIEGSLSRLGTDHVDLMMCPHGANTPYELLNYPEIFEAFETLRKAGKVRHLAVSSHTNPAGIIRAAIETGRYSAVMAAYNVVNHRYVDDAIAEAKQADVGVIAMKAARPVFGPRVSAARAKLIQDAVAGPLKPPQKAYLWVLRNPNLTAVNSEMEDGRMVADNLPLGAPRKSAG